MPFRRLILVLALLVVSGAAGLILQIGWTRQLRLIFGGTTAASATVLAIFLGGLGFGQWFWGRRIDRWTKPLRGYGLLELGVAVAALASPWLVDFSREIYLALGGESALGTFNAALMRIVLSAIVLGPATWLMGGTIPAAAAAIASDEDSRRVRVGWLYGLNTLGAVAGAAWANFYLLENIGTRASLWLAAGMLIAAGLGAIALSTASGEMRTLLVGQLSKALSEGEKQGNEKDPFALAGWVVGITSLASGFGFFLMEIVWYRALGPLLGGSTFTFGTILCVVLIGIAGGGILFSLLASRFTPRAQWLANSFALQGLLVAVPLVLGDRLAVLAASERVDAVSFADLVQSWLGLSALVILPAALLSGFQFPLLISLSGRGRRGLGYDLGWVYGLNSLGAISGALLGGFWLLPVFSAIGLWRATSIGLVGIGVVVAWFGSQSKLGRRWMVPGLLGLLCLWSIQQTGPTAGWRHNSIGAGRIGEIWSNSNTVQDWLTNARRQVYWETDGRESAMGIRIGDSPTFYMNGKSDGNAFLDAETQVGLGLLGPLLKDQIRKTLVIGLGTGETAGWLGDIASLEHLRVIEMEPAVLEMARLCEPFNRKVLENPKVEVILGDAREVALTTKDTYDLIVSEPSNPYRAGVANLLTVQFYKNLKARMANDGILLQWVQAYEVEEQTIASMLKTVSEVFADVQVWRTKVGDLVLVCRNQHSPIRLEDIDRRLQADPVLKEAMLRTWRLENAYGLLAHYVGGMKTIQSFIDTWPSPANTDDCTWLEYGFARSVGKPLSQVSGKLHQLAITANDDVPEVLGTFDMEIVRKRRLTLRAWWGEELKLPSDPSAELLVMKDVYQSLHQQEYGAALESWQMLQRAPEDPIEHTMIAFASAMTGIEPLEESVNMIAQISPAEVSVLQALAAFGRLDGSFIERLEKMGEELDRDPWASDVILGMLLAKLTDEKIVLSQEETRRIYKVLGKPWLGYRCETLRQWVAMWIAGRVGVEETARYFAAMEPNVWWREAVLEKRLEAYRATGNPLETRASNDLERFRYLKDRAGIAVWDVWGIR
jgi:spermidine synthase